MENKHEDKIEQSLRHVAKHYREGAMNTNETWEKFTKKNNIKRRPAFFRYWQTVAATVLVLLSISTWYFMTNEKENWLVVSTVSGQVKNVFLPDSSFVTMAENSTIKYDMNSFKKGRRDVEMKGKIFFQVKKKESSPFTVSTDRTVVKVLGTSFQLNEKDGETELYVATGKVSFSAKDGEEEALLTAGMSALYKEGDDAPVMQDENNTNVLSWRTKELHFNNTPLEKVIRDLSEYYSVKIVNRTSVENKHLTASFNNLPLEEALLIINQTLDVHLITENGL